MIIFQHQSFPPQTNFSLCFYHKKKGWTLHETEKQTPQTSVICPCSDTSALRVFRASGMCT